MCKGEAWGFDWEGEAAPWLNILQSTALPGLGPLPPPLGRLCPNALGLQTGSRGEQTCITCGAQRWGSTWLCSLFLELQLTQQYAPGDSRLWGILERTTCRLWRRMTRCAVHRIQNYAIQLFLCTGRWTIKSVGVGGQGAGKRVQGPTPCLSSGQYTHFISVWGYMDRHTTMTGTHHPAQRTCPCSGKPSMATAARRSCSGQTGSVHWPYGTLPLLHRAIHPALVESSRSSAPNSQTGTCKGGRVPTCSSSRRGNLLAHAQNVGGSGCNDAMA